MIVLGDISGIQNYLFDVSDAGGGQAQRLRARSFYVQILAEAAALRVLGQLGWPSDENHFVLSGAGKFLLKGNANSTSDVKLTEVADELASWLLTELRGELRIAIAWDDHGSDAIAYSNASKALREAKLRPRFPRGAWDPSRLVLPPLGRPCDLCGHATAVKKELDDETDEVREVCSRCAADRAQGRRLPRARWLLFRRSAESARDQDVFGLDAQVRTDEQITTTPDVVGVANLAAPDERPQWCPPGRFLRRRFTAHVPANTEGKPVWFVELARKATGDQLLGVLKADADSLGVAFGKLLEADEGIEPLVTFSRELDEFFGGHLQDAIRSDQRWQSVYTVFGGGDDLLLVGPWNVMFDFAAHVRELFQRGFGQRNLTLSAGLALTKPKRPIKAAAAEAERLLERAKSEQGIGASDAKDQFAVFGACWKWEHHAGVAREGTRLVNWVNKGEFRRGWLHTLLDLAEMRQGATAIGTRPDPRATARLAAHVERNYRRNSEPRRWGERLVERFDAVNDPEVRLVPVALRYALTATRTPNEEE